MGLHSLWSSRIHFSSHGWYLSSGRYQCFVFLSTGFEPLTALLGFISSFGESVEPQCSHWSP